MRLVEINALARVIVNLRAVQGPQGKPAAGVGDVGSGTRPMARRAGGREARDMM
jgi:hypothetical protein